MLKEPLQQPERQIARVPAGESLKEHGFLSRARKRGFEIAGKAALIAAIGLMSFGQVGCNKAPKPAETPAQPAAATAQPAEKKADAAKPKAIVKSKEEKAREKIEHFKQKDKKRLDEVRKWEKGEPKKWAEPSRLYGKKTRAR